MRMPGAWVLPLLCLGLAGHAAQQEGVDPLDEDVVVGPNPTKREALTFRARVTKATPAEPVSVHWRHGGEGLGGDVVRGTWTGRLAVGEWTPPTPLTAFMPKRSRLYLTVTLQRPEEPVAPGKKAKKLPPVEYRDVEMEFEVAYEGKLVKRFTEAGPHGGTIQVHVPLHRLTGPTLPTSPEFADELGGILSYARRRAEWLESLPWAGDPLPRRYSITTNFGGFGEGSGRGIRYTDPAVLEAELRAVRQLGVTTLHLADVPDALRERLAAGPAARALPRGLRMGGAKAPGYPVPAVAKSEDPARPARVPPGSGCPFGPQVAERTQAGLDQLAGILAEKGDEVWSTTVDEIGPIINGAPEGKLHVVTCDACAEGFRGYLRGKGLAPRDFGRADWREIRPVDIWTGFGGKSKSPPPGWLGDAGRRHLAYHTAQFASWSSARLFTPMRDFLLRANEEKRRALSAGRTDAPEAQRPTVYAAAMRGCTFISSGSTLDFFEFYRHADNAFVYETSNRDCRIWGWDSYMGDVGRILGDKMGLPFGCLLKPHRGAPIQRMLALAGRGLDRLHWYTYGPDYVKGDSFSQTRSHLELVSKAARLLGKSEDVLYGSVWAVPAEVALVRTWRGFPEAPHGAENALWEEGKWVYTALQHAHVPVDPLDEELLLSEDLARYKAIYVIGDTLPRRAAGRLADWVAQGGTLYTSACGLRFDETGTAAPELAALLGLRGRRAPELWRDVRRYGATKLDPLGDAEGALAPAPDGAKIAGGSLFAGSYMPVVGREVLDPAPGTEVLARFADGGAAATRRPHGKGAVVVTGVFAGLEYGAPLMMKRWEESDFDMARDFDPVRRACVAAPALARTRPVVDAAHPVVEGVLVRNPATGRHAVTLANWAYRVAGTRTVVTEVRKKLKESHHPILRHVPFEGLKVAVRGAGPVPRARSLALGIDLPLERTADGVAFVLPRLEEGDVVLLE